MATTNGVSDPKKELLVHRVDHIAETKPDTLFAEYPVSHNSYDDGFQRVTYGILANAANAVAWWLEATLGRGSNFETLAYIGPNDLRYIAFTLGAVKAGYLMLFVCPHNLTAAQTNLFTLLKCRKLLTGDVDLTLADVGLDIVKPQVLVVPSVEHLLSKEHSRYPYDKTFEQARSDPLVALHTSGSAGLPKPIVWTNEFASAYIKQASLEPPSGFKSQDSMFQKRRIFITFPPYNGAYIVNHLFNAIPRGTVMISTIDTDVPTTRGLIRGLQKTTADVAFLAPSLVVILARQPRKLDFVSRRVRLIMYCGGKIPEELGKIVASRIPLVDQYGASEIGLTAAIRDYSDIEARPRKPKSLTNRYSNGQGQEVETNEKTNGECHIEQIATPPEDLPSDNWNYVRFHPSIGSQMRHYCDNLYELVVARTGNDYFSTTHKAINGKHPFYKHTPHLPTPSHTPDSSQTPPLQPAFAFFPRASEYHTRDLWSPHPTKPGLWILRARIDDLFTLSTCHTINPIPYEHQIMASNPNIEGVLMWGDGRARPGLLVELQERTGDELQANGNGSPAKTNGMHRSEDSATTTNSFTRVNGINSTKETHSKADEIILQQDNNMTTSKRFQTLLRDLYLTIVQANAAFPEYMRVEPELVVLVDTARPMYRAGKGTIQRQLTLERYKEEIEHACSKSSNLDSRNGA